VLLLLLLQPGDVLQMKNTVADLVICLEPVMTTPASADTWDAEQYQQLPDFLSRAQGVVARAEACGAELDGRLHSAVSRVLSECLSDFGAAMEWHTKAVRVREDKLGKDHPTTAISYNYMGSLCHGNGEYDWAIEWYTKALRIQEAKLGKDHPTTAATYNNMGSQYYAKDEYDKAIEWHVKALRIQEAKLGKDHPTTATWARCTTRKASMTSQLSGTPRHCM